MSNGENNRDNETVPIEDPIDQDVQLRLYYVRMQNERNKLTINMKFDDGILPFTEGKRMYDKNPSVPFIYLLDLSVRMNKGRLYLQYQNGEKALKQYRLELSYLGALYVQQKFEEIQDEGHSLKDYFAQQHGFHFGIRFPSKSTSQASGKTHRRIGF